MAENVLVLKKKAVAAGMERKAAMKATRSQLEDFLSKPKASKKAAAKKKAPAKKAAVKKAAVKKPGRKPKATPKAKKAPVRKPSRKSNDGGRNMIDNLDFTETDGWNPRDGSPVTIIFKALKKAKGNVDKATDALLPDAKDFVGTKKQDGSRRSKDEMRDALRYRVNRTKWEFAIRTGQHEPSENRIEYGSGAYAQKRKKAVKKPARKPARKPAAKKTTKRKKSKR